MTDVVPASPAVDLGAAVEALAVEVSRVTALLRTVRDPDAHATGAWSLADVATHLSQAFVVVPSLARDDLGPITEVFPQVNGHDGTGIMRSVWDLGAITRGGVDHEPERDPRVLADRIDERAAAFLDQVRRGELDAPHDWMVEGVAADLWMLVSHLLNETQVHGHDIATADGQAWPLSRAHAAMAVEGFVIPMLQALGPRDMVDPEAAAGVRVTYDLHLRGAGRYRFAFDDGAMTITRGRVAGAPDCHLSADPAAMLLLIWGRRGQWPAIARGQLTTWGRRPWLALRMRSLVRNP